LNNILINSLPFILAVVLIQCKAGNGEGPGDQGPPELLGLNEDILTHPFEDSLYFIRGAYYYQNENYEEAVRDLEYAVSLDSLQPAYHHLLADAYLDGNRSYEALQTLKKAAALFPQRIPTLLKLSEFQFLLKQYEASLASCQQIRQLDPTNAEAWFMAGLNYRDLADTAQAISSLQRATTLDDRHTDAWIVLGQLWQNRDDELALNAFENALHTDSTNLQALHSLATYWQDLGRFERALELYLHIIRLDPGYTGAFIQSGLIYFQQDSFSKAFEYFDIACKQEPTLAAGYYYRGTSREALGDPEGAKSDYRQALRLDPDYPEATKALDLIN